MVAHAPPRVTPRTATPRTVVSRAARPAPIARDLCDPAQRNDPLAGALARSVRERGRQPPEAGGPVIQRWWAGIRQLSGMGGLGVPWDWGGNIFNWGLYHKHLFLEDGLDPADIGHMGPDGLGQDSHHTTDEYKKTQEGDDDVTMRKAIAKHKSPPTYSLLSSNCQKWVGDVIGTYSELGGTLGRQPVAEMSSI